MFFDEELKQLKITHEIALEEAYRKGFGHGHHVGEFKLTTLEKIREWRYGDENLVVGAPGTPYEGKLLCDLKPKEEFDPFEYQRKVYEVTKAKNEMFIKNMNNSFPEHVIKNMMTVEGSKIYSEHVSNYLEAQREFEHFGVK